MRVCEPYIEPDRRSAGCIGNHAEIGSVGEADGSFLSRRYNMARRSGADSEVVARLRIASM